MSTSKLTKLTQSVLLQILKTKNINAWEDIWVPFHRAENMDYLMESARVRYLHTSFLKQKQRVHKYYTKHFSCCNLFLLYMLRFSPFIRQNKCQVKLMFLFHLSAGTLSNLQNPNVNIFGAEFLPRHQSTLRLDLFLSFASSFQTFLGLVEFELFIVDNAYGIFTLFKAFLASGFR